MMDDEFIPFIEQVECVEVPESCLAELQIIDEDIPGDMLTYAMRKAYREFVKRSLVQVRTIILNAQCGVDEYPLDLPCDEELVAWQMQHKDPHRQEMCLTECGRHRVYWDVSTHHVKVHPVPDCEGPIRLKVATAPSINTCLVDKRLFDRHFDDLLLGAKAYLYLMTGTNVTWTNPGLAQNMELKFDRKITAASITRITGGTVGPFTMKTRRMV